MTHGPTLRKVTAVREIEHAEALGDAMLKTTAFAEAPPVAVGV
jgi:hypothetical protein